MLQTIIRNGDVDTVARGVYADWLDEHAKKGNGFKQLAAFIRWQCKFADIKPPQNDVIVAVRTQLRKLSSVLKVKGCSYFGTVPGYVKLPVSLNQNWFEVISRCGFIQEIAYVWCSNWARYGPFIITQIPINYIAFCDSPLRVTYNGARDGYYYRNRDNNPRLDRAYSSFCVPWIDDEKVVHHVYEQDAIEWFSSAAINWAKSEAEYRGLYGRTKFTFD